MNNSSFKKMASTRYLRMAAAIGFAAVTLTLASAAAHADEFVTNGDFSSNAGVGQLVSITTVTDWSVPAPNNSYTMLFTPSTALSGVSTQYGPDNVALYSIPSGAAPYFIGQDSDYDVGALTQTIDGMTVGDTYTLTYNWATAQQTGYSGGTFDNWTACLGSECDSTATVANPSGGSTGWYSVTDTFTASSSSEVLSFLATGSDCCGNTNNEPPFVLLDDVSLTGPRAEAPEPETLPLMLTGILLGLWTIARSRKMRSKKLLKS